MWVTAGGVVFLGVANRVVAFLIHRFMAQRPLPIDAERSAAVFGKGPAPNTGLFNRIHNLVVKHITLPAVFGYRHIQPLGWCTLPTRLQSILVFLYVALNFIFCAQDWHLFTGNL